MHKHIKMSSMNSKPKHEIDRPSVHDTWGSRPGAPGQGSLPRDQDIYKYTYTLTLGRSPIQQRPLLFSTACIIGQV